MCCIFYEPLLASWGATPVVRVTKYCTSACGQLTVWDSQIPYWAPNLEWIFKFIFVCLTTLQYSDKDVKKNWGLKWYEVSLLSMISKKALLTGGSYSCPVCLCSKTNTYRKKTAKHCRMILTEKPEVLLCYLMCICCTMCALLFFLFTLHAGLLARNQYSEGPATGHLDTGFSWFPCA